MKSIRDLNKITDSYSRIAPDGYEVIRIGFQQWEVRFMGETVKVCETERYAYNYAWRSIMGMQY